RTVARQSSRSNKLGMAPHPGPFAWSHLTISKFGSRASGRRRFCDSKHGFVERTNQWAANAVTIRDGVHYGLGSDARIDQNAGELAAECSRLWTWRSDFRFGFAGPNEDICRKFQI